MQRRLQELPTAQAIDADRQRLKDIDCRIQDREETIGRYEAQVEDTAQSLGYAMDALTHARKFAASQEPKGGLASTMQRVLERGTAIVSSKTTRKPKKSLTSTRVTQLCSREPSVFGSEEPLQEGEDRGVGELPLQQTATLRMKKTDNSSSRHEAPYEIGEDDIDQALGEMSIPELGFAEKHPQEIVQKRTENAMPARKEVSRATNAYTASSSSRYGSTRRVARAQTQLDPAGLCSNPSGTRVKKISYVPPESDYCDSRSGTSKYSRYMRNTRGASITSGGNTTGHSNLTQNESEAAGRISESGRYHRCTSTVRNSRPGSRTRGRTTRLSVARSPAQKLQTVAELWQEMWRKYSQSFAPSETEIFNLVEPLLDGSEIYKKFSTQYAAKLPSFDPLNARKYPPDRCGYGLRYMCISNDMNSLILKQERNSGSHYAVSIDSILRPTIPQQTIEIIRTQKSAHLQENLSLASMAGEETGILGKIASTIADKQSGKTSAGTYKSKCAECGYYPFWFELIDGGQLDLIATDYGVLKAWVMGISAIKDNQGVVEKFKALVDSLQNVVSEY